MKNLVNRSPKKAQSNKGTNVQKTINKRAKPPAILPQKMHQIQRTTKSRQNQQIQTQPETQPEAPSKLSAKMPLIQAMVQPLLLQNRQRVKKLHMPTELLLKPIRSQPVATTGSSELRNKRSKRQIPSVKASTATATAKPLSIVPVTKSRGSKGRTKLINIAAMTQNSTISTPCVGGNNKLSSGNGSGGSGIGSSRLRKRKISLDLADLPQIQNVNGGGTSALPVLRKSARLSKDGINNNNHEVIKIDTATKGTVRVANVIVNRREARQNKRFSNTGLSPPLTRSRLKELQSKLSLSSQKQMQQQHLQMLA